MRKFKFRFTFGRFLARHRRKFTTPFGGYHVMIAFRNQPYRLYSSHAYWKEANRVLRKLQRKPYLRAEMRSV